MNLQTHHTGQISGQIPNQTGTMLPGLPQQNGNPMLSQMQNSNVHRNVPNMDPETIKRRKNMQEKIWNFLMQRRQQSPEVPNRRMVDLVKRLEDGLFRNAMTMEEYLNLDTLERRLLILIKRFPTSNRNQQLPQANSSPSVGTMIPTPGFQQTGNSSFAGTSLVDNSFVNSSSNTIASSTVNPGSFFPTQNGSSGIVHGALAGGYQQSSNAFMVNHGGNNMMMSMGAQRMTSQMIPTTGINNSNSNDMIANTSNNKSLKIESSDVGACSDVDSTTASQPTLQKQHVGGQNSRVLHNIGGQMGSGGNSMLQQKNFGITHGPLSGGFGMIGKNMPVMNGPGTTEGHLSGTIHGNSTKPLSQHLDQHQQRPVTQGDAYGIGATGSGNMYIPATTVGSTISNPSLNSISMQSMHTTDSHLMTNNQSNVSSSQQATVDPHSIDQSQKVNFQSQYPVKENLVQPHQQQLFQQPSQQFQQQKPSQNQLQQKRQMPNQYLMRNDSFGQSHLSPSIIFEVKQEIGTEHYNEGIQSKVTHSFHADMQNQFQSNSVDDHPGAAQPFSHSSVPHDAPSLHPQQFVCSTSDFTSPCGGVQPDAALGSQRYSKPPDVDASGRLPIDQTIQNKKYQRVMRQDGAQLNNLSSEESVIDHSGNSRSTEPVNTSDPASRTYSVIREKQFKNQQRWLLFLRHARRCHFLEGKCPEPNCLTAQKLLKHIGSCNNFDCSYPRCRVTWDLVNHHRRCQDTNCPVCIPVKKFMQTHFKAFARSNLRSGLPTVVNESSNAHDIAGTLGRSTPKMDPVMAETPEDLQPPIKRVKVEQSLQSLVPSSGCSVALASTVSDGHIHDVQHSEKDHDYHIPVKPEISDLKVAVKAPVNVAQECPNIEISKDNVDDAYIQTLKGDGATLSDSVGCGAQQLMKTEKDTAQAKLESTSLPPEGSSKSGKPNIKGVSMIELFTPEMVRLHIMGLRQWVGQSKAKAERNQAMEHSMSENSCQLCAVERLSFEPPPVYCTLCSIRIKRNGMYYSFGSGETRYCFCNHCYNSSHGDTIAVDGTTIPKGRVEKKKNDEETEEWWVQCDKCEAWQHQICALFNGRRNNGGEAEYTCPNCYMAEVEMGERAPLPQSAVLGAKDLPRSQLSDHLEQRLIVKLKQERLDRASHQGKSYDEVPGAEELVVRVVSSVDKKLDVKPRFLEIFQEENYPTEYPYKSKAVLLFQRIEGVEVCLFGMYVQEFGSECQQPNNRRVYISYLDSVKYFRPEVKTVSGEALRTYVYHEILIGYLDYCKMRGFTSCYIWACPPLKGEDYILYCHPEIQKTPKSDKLREWYLAMLRKATRENIVVELTNMYEHFFVSTGECKAKVTASRLPYFDGDYWPGAAEDFIYQFQQEEDGRKHSKKGASLKKSITKRALRASGQTDLSSNALKDLMLMHKLGDSITTCKEDFIMVHLQHSCSHCCILIFSGKRWVCKQCKKFHLCDNCYDAERKRDDRERHPVNYKDVHTLYPVDVAEVPDDTKDNENLESEFFDTRQAFLSLCQGNYYQYDTLRRAKHSSMMVLYHLHNPTAPAFVITCTKCNLDIESGQGWRCETCPEYDICNACYQKDGGKNHPHKLTKNQSIDPNAQNKEAKQLRLSQVRKMLDLLVHASQCRSTLCQYPNCRKVKGLFRHGILCKRRAAGGCHMCTKMWQLLQLHARACKESDCNVPRCRDLREHLRRLQHQADSRRRAAVMEMMRQRAAEVAGSS